MKTTSLAITVLLLVACSGRQLEPEPTSPDPTPTPDPTGGVIVHEWGTFTSVRGSTGAQLEGLHHEEEALPSFVHGRGVMASGVMMTMGNKDLEAQPSSVTQKLETPVLYFYGAAA